MKRERWLKRLSRIGLGVCVCFGFQISGLGFVTAGPPIHQPVPIPEPLGSHLSRFETAQNNKAEETDFVFFLDEWYLGGTRLGPHGLDHLNRVLQRLPETPFPVVIQPDKDDAMNEARRQVLVAALLKHGIADAESRVIVAYPEAGGLYGEETERIYYEMLAGNKLGCGYSGCLGFGCLGYGGFGYGGYCYGRGGCGVFGRGYGGLGAVRAGFLAGPFGY
jgi:hypothetical protein